MTVRDGTVDFEVKQGSTANKLTATLRDGAGNPIDLSAAGTSVRFSMRPRHGSGINTVDRATVTKLDDGSVDTRGQVEYAWTAADLATVGTYRATFKVTFADSTVLRVPDGQDYLVIVVAEAIDE